MSNFDALERLQLRATHLALLFAAPSEMAQLVERLGEVALRPPSPDRLARVRERVIEAHRTNTLEGVQIREWKVASWLLCDSNDALRDIKGIFGHFCAVARQTPRVGILKRLIAAYLFHFNALWPRGAEIGVLIREMLERLNPPKLILWRQRDQLYALFSPAIVARKAADHILARGDASLLQSEFGLQGQLADGQLVVAVWREIVRQLGHSLSGVGNLPLNISGLFECLAPSHTLRFAELRIEIANSLLIPFEKTSGRSEAFQAPVKEFFLRVFGDPRSSIAGNWHGVDPRAIAVMRRLVAQETLRLFFEIITRASQSDDYIAGTWKYRRAFWSGCLAAGGLEDAWMVLGTGITRVAKAELTPGIGYGRLTTGDSLDAALIMKVRNLMFVEWSYNGKCRAWTDDDPTAPRSGRSTYATNELKLPGLKIVDRYVEEGLPHSSGASGTWQALLADFIKRRTGLTLARKDYMP